MRARQAMVVAAVTGAVAAAAKPRARRSRTARHPQVEPQVPAQRASGLAALGLGVADLEVSAHDEQDARLVEALEWHSR
jgi:hypothetical protein